MGTRFMSVGKGKDRKAFPLKGSKNKVSKQKFNSKSTTTKSRFKVPTLPNDPPKAFLNEKSNRLGDSKTLESVIKNIEQEWKKSLNEHDFENERLKNIAWDVDISYTGSHGTVDSEFFTLTAFGKGLGDVETNESLSNMDWNEEGDENESTEEKYESWLADAFELYEDSMFESLTQTIEDTYREEKDDN